MILQDGPYDLDHRSVFNAAGNHMESKDYRKAMRFYQIYVNLEDNSEDERFISYLRIGMCMSFIGSRHEDIVLEVQKAINVCPDRAEPYFFLGKECNKCGKYDDAYRYLHLAKSMNLNAEKKRRFVDKYSYGKYVNEELSVACFWTNRGGEGYMLLTDVINEKDDDFFMLHMERLERSKKDFETTFPFTQLLAWF